jgi:adenylate cyclase class IV
MLTEVEKKYPVTEEGCKDGLLQEAEFVSEKEHTDVYYDTADSSLLRRDVFLRRREGTWELKVGKPGSGQDGVRQYDEPGTDAEIREALSLGPEGTLEEAIAAAGFAPFVTIETRRRKYKLGDFTIDFDHSTYPQGDTFDMTEVELLADDRTVGKQRLLEFQDQYWLPADAEMRGKVQEYCFRHDPERWAIFVEIGLAVE